MKRILLLLLLLLVWAAPAWADTHTVCSSGCNYSTIAAAEAGVTAGDTVNVSSGTYAEAVNPLFTKQLTWVAIDGDRTVTIRNSAAGTYAAAFASNTSVISIRGFVFDGQSTKTNAFYFATSANNKVLLNCTFLDATTDLVALSSAQNPTITDCIFSGTISGSAISGAAVGGVVITRPIFNHTGARGVYFTGDTGTVTLTDAALDCYLSSRFFSTIGTAAITVTGNIGSIYPNSTGPSSFFYVGTAAKNGDILVSANSITYPSTSVAPTGHLINVSDGGHNVTVSNNIIIDLNTTSATYEVIKIHNQPTVTVADNTITSSNPSSNGARMIDVTSAGTAVTVDISRNNINFAQTGNQAILVGSDTSTAYNNRLDGAIILSNIIMGPQNAGVHGIEYGYNKNGVIRKNKVQNCGYGIVVKGNAEVYTAGGVYGNILIDQTTEQLRLKGAQNVPVSNNTFIISSGRTVTNGSIYLTVNADSSNVPSTGATLRNNLIWTQTGQYQINCDANSAAGLTVDYSSYWDGTGIRNKIGSTTYTNWATWQGLGYDASSATPFDPLLQNIAGQDYSLLPTSPLINAGVVVTGIHDQATPATDITGTSILTLPDIGAYEYPGGLYFNASATGSENGTSSLPYNAFSDYTWTGYNLRTGAEIYFRGALDVLDISGITDNGVIIIKPWPGMSGNSVAGFVSNDAATVLQTNPAKGLFNPLFGN